MRVIQRDAIARIVALCACCLLTPVYAGDVAALQFQGVDGQWHKMHEFIGRGKWVLLNVWGVRCPACVEEMPDLQTFHDDFSDKNAIILGFAIDFPSFEYADREEVATFMHDHVLDFPNLLGDAESYRAFGAGDLQGTPTMLVFTPEGKLIARQLGQLSYAMLVNFIQQQEKLRAKSGDGQ